jgi:hypothetical protein
MCHYKYIGWCVRLCFYYFLYVVELTQQDDSNKNTRVSHTIQTFGKLMFLTEISVYVGPTVALTVLTERTISVCNIQFTV